MIFKCKQWIADRLFKKDVMKATLVHMAYWLAVLAYLELLLHAAAFGMPDMRFGFVLAFGLVFACALTAVLSFLPKKLHYPATLILTVVLTVLYGSQMVYYFIFGTLYSVAQMQQGGAALTSFWKETLLIMGKNWPWILLVLIPVAASVFLRKLYKGSFAPSNAVWRVLVVTVALVAQLATVWAVQWGDTGYFSNYYFYSNDSTTTGQATERFGLMTAFRLDLQASQSAAKPDDDAPAYYVPEQTQPATVTTQPQETQPPQQQETQPTEPTEPKIEYNVLDIDFDELNKLTENEKILALNQYCASLTGTNKNEYTGMLSDYNLIMLCAESFSSGAIHKELTPTLYKLANEGILFQNYYTTFPNNTTDGEYTFCMGLYPDMSRGKTIASFYASRNSYLPYCLGNIFREQRGITSYGYHNYFGDYYGRDQSHPNMGYKMKFANNGMLFPNAWPSSDLEMMMQSVDDYISADQQFHAYYMTFSGHLAYDIQTNPMAVRNWHLVQDLPLGYEAKCYLSCNIELDKALAYLMERLEEAGVADKTAIVLAADHHPYGLTDAQYSDVLGEEVVKFTKFKSNLIFWVGGLEEPIVVDEYCSTVDVLPTILNLWGFEFDSRLLTGTDVFSDGVHMAVLQDKSFFTDKVWVNTEHGIIQYLVDPSELPDGYIDDMMRIIETKYALSTDILNTAYYNFVFDKGPVEVYRYSWE